MQRLPRRAAIGAAGSGLSQSITTDAALEAVFLNMHGAGVGVILKRR